MSYIPISELYKCFVQSAGICTDSRAIYKDCIFWSLKGPNFDGNSFAQRAIEEGALYAVVDDPEKANGETIFLVQEGLKALQELATFHRSQFEIPILAITGSNGKTTTKELIARVLSQVYRCHFTKGNFNNHIGVPLTLLAMSADTEVAIIEMGANHQGEIAELCDIARPTHGIITNIGKAHLEGFGGLEGVKKGKSELYRFLAKNNGVAFINKEEEFLTELSAPLKHRRVYYGLKTDEEENTWLRVQSIPNQAAFLHLKFWSDDDQEIRIDTQLIGAYNLANLATAACLGLYFKVPAAKIKLGIESYVPADNRSQLVAIPEGEVILDAYNANPSSMEKALANFNKMEGAEKWLILGAMKELGDASTAEHLSIATIAQTLFASNIFLVGAEFQAAARKLDLPSFLNVDELKAHLPANFFQGKNILIKGSRSIHLEKLIQ